MFTKLSIILIIITLLAIGIITYHNRNKPESVTISTTKPFKIVAFGDSLTAGYGIAKTDSYPSLLQEKLQTINPEIQIVNLGVSGDTSTGGLKRINAVLKEKPDLVLLELGANDMFRKVDPAIVKSNLEQMIIAFKKENIDVILLGMRATPLYGLSYKRQFDSLYDELADEYNLPLVPYFLNGVALNNPLNISDRIHPNKEGYKVIVEENVYPVVATYLQ